MGKHIVYDLEARPYDLKKWIADFDAATLYDRPAVAENWLKDLIADVAGCQGLTSAQVFSYRLAPDMERVRDFAVAIPEDSSVFIHPANDTRNPVGTWLRYYFNTAVPLRESTDASVENALLRDMWLKKKRSDRLDAMLLLANNMEGVTKMRDPPMSILKKCAWSIAAGASMHADITMAATKLTCWAHRSFHGNETGMYELADALILLMGRCQHGPNSFESRMHTRQAKAVMVKHPAACAYLLQWIESGPTFSERRLLHTCAPGVKVIDSLRTWLPDCDSAISLGQEMGLSYMQILSLVLESLATEPEMDLPGDVSQGVPL
jgi:hypothetical protein